MNVFRVSRRMEFCDTDMAGIVHFANFFRFMESAECAFLRSRGLGVILEWEGQPISFPRVSATCDYAKPAKFEDVIDIDVAIGKVGTKSITYSFLFSRDGEAIARGQITSVCCRVNADGSIQSMEIPERYRQKLEGISSC